MTHHRILVVEDNRDIANVLQLYLSGTATRSRSTPRAGTPSA